MDDYVSVAPYDGGEAEATRQLIAISGQLASGRELTLEQRQFLIAYGVSNGSQSCPLIGVQC